MNANPLSPRRAAAGLLALVALLFAGAAAQAAPGAQGASGSSAVAAAAVLGPLGISPFFALGGLGLAAWAGVYQLPAGLELFAHPALVISMLVFGFMLQAGRSTKLTKPLAEVAGLGESAFALVAALALALPHFAGGPGAAEAGLVDGALLFLAAGSAVTALIILRTALDVMIWLSPFPFVDAGFQTVKLGVTGVLIGAAILAPPVALVLNGLILVATFVFVRWAVRQARFGLTIVYDLTLGRGRALELPRDEVIDGDLGPFRAFALEAPGLPPRAPAEIELRAGRWFLVGAGPGGPTGPDTPLGDGDRATLTPTWAGLELSVGPATVLLPPRYRSHAEQIRLESRATAGASARWVPPVARRRGAGASTL